VDDLFKIDVKRKSAVDVVVDRIKLLLIEKKLKPGDLIPSENVLAQSLKVSRSSIREAMKILAAYGIVEVRRGAGTYISSSANHKIFDPLLFQILVSDPDYKSLIEVRELMEKGIVDLILKNANEDDYKRLDKAMKEFDLIESMNPVDRKEGDAADIKYHRVMGEISHNKIVSNIYYFVIDLFSPTINSSIGYKTHKAMHEAIMKKDYESAMEMVKIHTSVWSHFQHET
jgi:GntR family transcriptional regulator, transcriptional repressor for pyruvate dehydrogenase complex